MFRKLASVFARIALATAFLPGLAWAQPDLVRIIVPLGAGHPFDTAARALAEGLAKVSGKTVIVENKPGAGGRIATADVAKAKADGSVLLFTTAGHATNAGLYSNLSYDPIKDFTPISVVSKSSGFVLLVPANSPHKSIQELISAAKAKPDTMNYGSFGNGNTTHVVAAMFARAADLKLIHVPHQNPVNDLIGSHINMLFMGASTALPLVSDGRVRALAISSEARDPEFPGVPTFRELGFNDVDVPAWSGLLAPAGLPADQTQALFAHVKEAVKQPAYQNNLKITKATVVLSSPEEYRKSLETDVTRFRKVLPELGIKGN
jgi:tripartite-type tricarboxylate transporter receptor subunit TctC